MIPHAYVNVFIAGDGETPPATEVIRYDDFVKGLAKPQSLEKMKTHAMLGVCSEAGELASAFKDEIAYEKTHTKEGILIRDAIIEELGDLQWFMQLTMQLYDITPTEVFQHNADKLAKRYVNLKYSDKAAQERADKK